MVGAFALALGLGGCADGGSGPPVPWVSATLWPALTEPSDNPSTPEKVALGRLLFYDPILSDDGETACATCHSEIWGMADGLPKAIGVGAGLLTGPGRTGPSVGTRNAQSLWNVGYREVLFWDGRVSTLEEQALAPLHNELELAKPPAEVIEDLSANAAYAGLFEAAFPEDGEPVTERHLAQALAAFQRSLLSDRAPYDAYVEGDARALAGPLIDGMWRFAAAGCDSCHAPPLFASDGFYVRGAGDGTDAGRFDATSEEADRRAFRVPSLRNVRDTGPYFHDGSVESLEDAVRQELALRAGAAVDEADVTAIAAFLSKGLTDSSQEPDRPDAVPSGLDVPIDGFRIPR